LTSGALVPGDEDLAIGLDGERVNIDALGDGERPARTERCIQASCGVEPRDPDLLG
jgi:hypothetical protein